MALKPKQTLSRFILAISTLLLISLTGCFQDKLPPGTIRLVVWGLQFGSETKGLEARITAFERMHPHIHVSVLSMGAGSMNPQKLMTAIAGGIPPDVIRQDRFTIGDWASRGAFLPLDSFLKGQKPGPYAIKESHFYPACWKEAVYQGHVFAIPSSTDDRALYYNKTLFREAGLNPNKPPQTWGQLYRDSIKLTKLNPDGSFKSIGFIPNYGNSWLYLYSWQNGGEFMSPNGRTCTINNPYTVGALQFMVKIYDALGGVTKVDSFASGFQPNELDPFLTGKVAMKIDGDWVLDSIARYNPSLDYGVAPAPVPRDRLLQIGRFKGHHRFITWSGGFSYAIPRGAKHLKQAWEFIQWMTSPAAGLVDARAQQAYNRSQGRPYVPTLSANKRVNEEVFKQYAPKDPKFREPLRFFINLMRVSKFRPVTFVGQLLWDQQVQAMDEATHHHETGETPYQALTKARRMVQIQLNKVYSQTKYPLLNQLIPILITAFFVAIGTIFLVIRVKKLFSMGRLSRGEAIAGTLFAMPWLLGFLVFTAGPIIASFLLSFCDYDVLHPPRFVGLLNYIQIFGIDRQYLYTSLWNAFYLAIWGIPLGIATGLAIAMLLNAKVSGMSFYRTFFYMPSIVPLVASAVLWAWILNGDPNQGLLNAFWKATITAWFHIQPPGWFGAAQWAKPGLIVMGLWGAGSSMILWLAGLQGVPRQLYEAADLDGAGIWSKFWNVTIPMLSPYIFFNLIMGTIAVLQQFDQVYILSGQGAGANTAGPVNSMLVPVLLLFNDAFRYFKMGYASALAWILFVIILALTAIQLKIAPRWVHYEVEKK